MCVCVCVCICVCVCLCLCGLCVGVSQDGLAYLFVSSRMHNIHKKNAGYNELCTCISPGGFSCFPCGKQGIHIEVLLQVFIPYGSVVCA